MRASWRQPIAKQLTCPECGYVAAHAVYRPWPGKLTITASTGHDIPPTSGALLLRTTERAMASGSGTDLATAAARRDFVHRNLGEVMYDICCPEGHWTLCTAPQIARAMRSLPGEWVRLG